MKNSSSRRDGRNNISTAKKLSFSAISCALGVILLFLGAVIETVDISMAALASFLIVVCMIEMGGYFPFLVYLATATLSFLMLPNKTVVLIYGMFFGFYPILKKYLERLPFVMGWVAKIAVFNVVIALYYVFLREVLFPDIDGIKIYLFLLLNVIFITLDITQTLFVTAYVRRFRKMLGLHRFFK
ncbi:MAG: hypothetical protein E7615_06180 [Ruminococcaceae bacterium]|nr:hypothetical protein [Oscillospiraceae bacterium]